MLPDLKFVDLMRPNKVIDDLDGTGPVSFLSGILHLSSLSEATD